MKQYQGLTIVTGRTFGPLIIAQLEIDDTEVLSPDEEWQKFTAAKLKLSQALEQRSQDQSLTSETAAIFEAHRLMLDDPEFSQEIKGHIDSGSSFEKAVLRAAQDFSDMMSAIEDEYMQARAADIRDIAQQLVTQGALDVAGKIVLKEEIFPSEVIEYTKAGAKGFLSLKGSATSHASILAKNAGLPFITNLPPEVMTLSGTVYLDDHLMVDLTPEELAEFEQALARDEATRQRLAKLIDQPGHTADGLKRQVSANISSLDDLKQALELGAEGVALFRTEFLFMQPTLPTRDEQKALYRSLASALNGKSFIIRTMDLGGDKVNRELDSGPEDNPFLGLRGIRLSFEKLQVFKRQLKAILEVASEYPIKMMFPMITNLEDVYQAKEILAQAEAELKEEGLAYAIPQLGVMIEVPSALALIKEFSDEVDFISFGTNDLLQYTTASDRMNSRVSRWYDPYQPAFLRLIARALDETKGLHVGMCGDLAADELLIPFWSAIGFEELGVPAARILKTKQILLESRSRDQTEWIEYVLSAKTSQEVIERLHRD